MRGLGLTGAFLFRVDEFRGLGSGFGPRSKELMTSAHGFGLWFRAL